MEQELKRVLRDSGLLVEALGEEKAKFEHFISPSGYENDQLMFEIAGSAKGLLQSMDQLGRQMVLALQGRSLFLALLGVRTSLEYVFRIRYIFDHPKHQGDKEWTGRLAIELGKAQPGLAGLDKLVNMFDGKNLKNLASDVEMSKSYEEEYASLCHFAHPGYQAIHLMKTDISIPWTAQAAVSNVTFMLNAMNHAGAFWQYPGSHELEHQISALADEVEKKFPMPPS